MDSFLKLWFDLKATTLGAKVGPTDYFDQYKVEDMSDPCMKGEDKWGRKFIACQAHFMEQAVTEDGRLCDPVRCREIVVIFQRYAEAGSIWVACARNGATMAFSANQGPIASSVLVDKFLKGETLGYRDSFIKNEYTLVKV